MKLFLLIYYCFLVCMMGMAQNRINIEVSGLDNLNNKQIILSKGLIPFVKTAEVIDSAQIVNGKVKFSFTSKEVSYYALLIKGTPNFTSFVGKPNDKIILRWKMNNLDGNASNVNVLKSTENIVYYKVVNEGKPLILRLNSYIDSASKVEDTVKRGFYLDQNKYWSDSLNRLYIRLLKKYPNSYSSLSALSAYYKRFSDDYVRNYIKNLPTYLKNNELVNLIEYNKFELPAILKQISGFKDFKFLSPQADTFSYNAYATKIVLLDFWTSWCSPCIGNFPKLEEAKKNFDTSRFEIIGISFDDGIDKWKEGMKNHHTSFVNVYAPAAWESLVAKYFKVKEIPRYVLLGKDGKVLNNNVEIDNLAKEISKALEVK